MEDWYGGSRAKKEIRALQRGIRETWQGKVRGAYPTANLSSTSPGVAHPNTTSRVPQNPMKRDALQLKQHFLTHYAPWLPAISLFATSTSIPLTISPFLSTTASRTWPTPLPYSTISSLRA
ncbi:hypothetical protein M422DRAFT_253603 [Sphaerobolus stellatus SS14]|uniref:Uncharacterized protein n=1 Tax=Sphaerobolus stellatus (strain SS14) TaxID=990650 RepID=A0A0C9UJ48_SPHS4|nr:hypothetical protein M422DRAFT_253603 [Sphaerobolus stellatus SS14]